MKEKPKISVVIPTYNEETNIKRTLKAVRDQICDIPYEIIVARRSIKRNAQNHSQKDIYYELAKSVK